MVYLVRVLRPYINYCHRQIICQHSIGSFSFYHKPNNYSSFFSLAYIPKQSCLNNCALDFIMSFSNLVSDIAFRDADRSSQVSHARSQATARSHTSTAATSVSISGDISSQLHAGYSHPLSRLWQTERQLTKVSTVLGSKFFGFLFDF